MRNGIAATLVLVMAAGNGLPAQAQTIIDEWNTVQAPPAPALQSVSVDPASTALLILDFNGSQGSAPGPCNPEVKPRCTTSIPKVKALLDAARANKMLVVYSLSTTGAVTDIAAAIAPKPGDPIVKAGPDKFVGTTLAPLLAGKGIKTIIITGTGAEGAVLDTATEAVLRQKLRIIIPVDGMSSTNPYAEQYVAWHLTHAPGFANKVTLTRSDLITF